MDYSFKKYLQFILTYFCGFSSAFDVLFAEQGDFFLYYVGRVIELDGSQHYSESGMLKDKIRTERIEERDLTVVRIPNNEINKNFNGVCEYIDLLVTKNVK